MATFDRTWTITATTINVSGAGGDPQEFYRQEFLRFKNLIAGAGWTAVASSNGSTVSTSGDIVTTTTDVTIGRPPFNEPSTWIVFRAPSSFISLPSGRSAFIVVSTDESPTNTSNPNLILFEHYGIFDPPDLSSGTTTDLPVGEASGSDAPNYRGAVVSNGVTGDINRVEWTAADGSFAWATRDIANDTVFRSFFCYLGNTSGRYSAFGFYSPSGGLGGGSINNTVSVWQPDGVATVSTGQNPADPANLWVDGQGTNGVSLYYPIYVQGAARSDRFPLYRYSTDFFAAPFVDPGAIGLVDSSDTDPQRLVCMGGFWAPMNVSDFPLD